MPFFQCTECGNERELKHFEKCSKCGKIFCKFCMDWIKNKWFCPTCTTDSEFKHNWRIK